MPFIETQHATLYYDFFEADVTTEQPAKTVLLLHGFAGTPESDFEDLLPHLRTDYHVLAPHLHGYGRSTPRTEYTTLYYRESVVDIITLLDDLNLAEVLIVGFSDGAIVALLMAALHPLRVEAMAILGAQATINARDAAAIRSWLLEKPLPEEWQEQLAQLHGEPYGRTLPALYVQVQEDLVAKGGTLILEKELAAIRCPTLIMHGVRDRVVSVDYAYVLHQRIPGSHLLLFSAGHAAHIRCARVYRTAVIKFLKSGTEPTPFSFERWMHLMSHMIFSPVEEKVLEEEKRPDEESIPGDKTEPGEKKIPYEGAS